MQVAGALVEYLVVRIGGYQPRSGLRFGDGLLDIGECSY
jgi:hypothetical protein